MKQTKIELENAKNSTSAKIEEVTKELLSVKKEKEKLEKEKVSKEIEIKDLRKKNLTLEKTGMNAKKLDDLKQSYEEKITSKIL